MTGLPDFRGAPAVPEVEVLWLTAGLSCDGDSVSITAASQPSLEELLQGALPGLPKVILHHPVLADETGDDFLAHFHRRPRRGDATLRPGRGGVDSQREDQGRRLLGGFRHGSRHRPADHHLPLDRPTGPAGLGRDRGGDLCDLWWHPRHGGKPHRGDGPDRLPGRRVRKAGLPIVNIPGCPVQPDNFTETLLYLLYQAAGLSPPIPLDEVQRPRGSSVRRCTRGAIAAATTSRPTSRPSTDPRSAS